MGQAQKHLTIAKAVHRKMDMIYWLGQVVMQAAHQLTPKSLVPFLLNVAPTLPVFIWGPPGIGKSAIVRAFAEAVGLPCISLLGSQLAPEDIIGVPQVVDGRSRFCPPTIIARDEPYCLFLDELNACSQEVQKAFYSLILDRRIGEFQLPPGTVVIGAGNRTEDAAITRPLSSALINPLVHVQLRASARDWLEWADDAGIHELIVAQSRDGGRGGPARKARRAVGQSPLKVDVRSPCSASVSCLGGFLTAA